METGQKRVRVLSIDGGGMRGLYTAAYLSSLAKQYAANRKVPPLDIGKGFDLITGTSTGGIIACALAVGMPMDDVVALYRDHGREIFPVKLPDSVGVDLACQLVTRPRHIHAGADALQRVLQKHLGDETIGQVYERRGIALSIPAVEMSRHRSYVFKTSHLGGHRDDNYRLVDACLATSAAPIYRAMAKAHDSKTGHTSVFVDGGLWANNPVLVGLIDALQMASDGDLIEIFSLGNCQRPSGHVLDHTNLDWGLKEWKFGGEAMSVSLDAQEYAFHNMARLLLPHLKRRCSIARFPHGSVPADAMKYLDLDETSAMAAQVLINQANTDVSDTLAESRGRRSEQACLLDDLFNGLPSVMPEDNERRH